MASDRRVHEPYVLAAIIVALTAGFGYGAILLGAIAFKIPIGAWWIALAQAHGHAQLFGWAGLFVLGVGLFFLPRLRGTTLARPELAPYALMCLSISIALRVLAQPLGASTDTSIPQGAFVAALGRSGIALSGIIELGGVALIITMLVSAVRRARPLGAEAPIVPVRPYLATAFISLVLASFINAILSIYTALSDNFIFSATWDDALVHLMIFGFIVPIAMSLSVRNLPLFMRLAMPPRRELLPLWIAYVTGLVLRLAGGIAHLFVNDHTVELQLGAVGAILEGGAILAFVWMLDVLVRRKTPWIASRATYRTLSPNHVNSPTLDPKSGEIVRPSDYIETRKPTRKNYPDYGEFGRFELLVISAFVWLVFAACIAVINGVTALFNGSPFFNPDIERHAITVGFITLLIFGMAVRMLPGFSKSRVASTRLVMTTFWLGNLAAILRVVPLFAPQVPGASIALGISGVIGWLAVACLGVNVWRTFHS